MSPSRWRSRRRSSAVAPGARGRSSQVLAARSALLAAVTVTAALAVAGPAEAAPSAGIIGSSRITVGSDVTATAVSGDTLYLGGAFSAIGYRAAGLAATDPATGELDLEVAEPRSTSDSAAVETEAVVPDGAGGVFVLGVRSGPRGGAVLDGAETGSRWFHLDADGRPDSTLAGRLRTADGSPAELRDVSLGADGTTYLAGTFTQVDGRARPGLAAIGRDGALTPWSPNVTGGPVSRLQVAGDDVLLVGGIPGRDAGPTPTVFTAVGGRARAGLALVNATTGAVREAWSPEGLDQRAAATDITTDGTSLYLLDADRSTVRAVTIAGTGAVRDLDLRPSGGITDIVAIGGTMYAAGRFRQIGSQPTQPNRGGLAEIDPSTGRATGWNPPSRSGVSGALAVDATTVYVGGSFTTDDPCGAGYRRTDGSRTDWRPELKGSGGAECSENSTVLSLAVSGGRVWAGGRLVMANSRLRQGLAAIDVAKDEILPWAPENGALPAQDLEVSPDGRSVYIAAEFSFDINGQPRRGIGAVAATGAANTADDVRPFDPAPDGSVTTMAFSRDGTELFLGGSFTLLGEVERPRLAAVSPTTGAPTAWTPSPDAPVDELEVSNAGTLYAAGQFTTIGGADRRFLAAFDATPGAPTAWDPKVAPDAGDAPAVVDLAVGDGVVYAAGSFNGEIGGKRRRGVAALDPSTGAATDWDAGLDGAVTTVSTTADGTVYIAAGDGSAPKFQTVQGKQRAAGVASLTPGGALTRWAPGQPADPAASPSLGAPPFTTSAEVREIAGRVVLPIGARSAFQGLAQVGFLAFGDAGPPPAPRTPADPPTVSGTPDINGELTCEPGSYTGELPLLPSYAWLADGRVIAGQTATTYTVRESNAGADISCRETVENVAGELATTSASVRAQAVRATNEAAPEVTGDLQVGRTVGCSEGLWSTRVDSYSYRWLRAGTAIPGETGASYAVGAGDTGSPIACEVTAVNGAGPSSPARSLARTVGATSAGPGPGAGSVAAPDSGPGVDSPSSPGPAPAPSPAPGSGPAPAPGPAATPGAGARPKVAVGVRATGAKGRRITLTVSPSTAGRVTVSATTGTGRRKVTVGSGRATAKKAGALKVTVAPTRKGRKALRAGRTARVTFRVTFTASGGRKVTTTRTLRVRIRR